MLRARSDISGISDSDGDETYVTIEGRMTLMMMRTTRGRDGGVGGGTGRPSR